MDTLRDSGNNNTNNISIIIVIIHFPYEETEE